MSLSTVISVSSTSSAKTILQKAAQLAKNLSLPLVEYQKCQTHYILTFTEQRLELHFNRSHTQNRKQLPIYVDFLAGSYSYRFHQNRTIRQPLARAVGIKSGIRPRIFDATAGLGADGFVLASLGARVTLNERSPIIFALLDDGVRRARNSDCQIGDVMRNNIELSCGNSIFALDDLPWSADTVYLDPMYPHSGKTALNSLEMRSLRDIVGDDEDSGQLLCSALENASKRVTVKRPKTAAPLSGRRPDFEVMMKNSRFDVYLT